MATEKEAKRVITLEDIKFKEENKVMAALSCLPLLGLIFFFVEKKDLFVRYHAAQFALTLVLPLVIWIPCIGQLIGLALFVLMIVGIVKTLQGERFDIPVLSGLALKMMNSL